MLVTIVKRNVNKGSSNMGKISKKISRTFWPFTSKTDQKKTKEQEMMEKDIEDFTNLGFMIKKIKDENSEKDSLLPPQDPSMEGKLTVCMEMDEVFLHVFYPDEYEGYLNQPLRDHDYYIDFEEYNTFLNVYKRNKCDELFSFLENETEAVIFSTGTKEYVDKVMDFVDPDYKVFKHRLYQDSCNFVNQEEEELQEFVKDLDWLGRDIKRTVLIDPKPFSFWCNPDNSIPVKPYNGHSLSDKEIDIIISILDDLRSSSDVSFELAQSFGIRDTLREANLL